MEIEKPDIQTLLASLRGTVCPACGKPKKSNQTFCGTDYGNLNLNLRRRVYDRVGHGYEEAVMESMKMLGATRFLMHIQEPPLFGEKP